METATTDDRFFSIRIGSARARVRIAPSAPPELVAALFNMLPFSTELHYTKISGEGVLFFAPFFLPPRRMVKVEALKSGTVAYWPNRQQILIYYGKFEKEDASVMILGRIDQGLDRISIEGEKVRSNQGRIIELSPEQPGPTDRS